MLNDFYKKQIQLDEIGIEGQEKLSKAKVLIVGAGGLGHPALLYLVGAGIGTIGVIDNDIVNESNLHRQILFSPNDIGKLKVDIVTEKAKLQNPLIEINKIPERLKESNLELLNYFDLVLDCTDNFQTKFLIHDFCFENQINLIQASIHKFEGTLNTFQYKKSHTRGCYRCLWDKQPAADAVGTCSEVGTVGAVAGVLGTLQAMEAIKLTLGLEVLDFNETLTFDLHTMETCRIAWQKNPKCELCLGIYKKPEEKFEVEKLSNSIVIKVDKSFDFEDFIDEYKEKPNYLFVCDKGISSYRVVKQLRSLGRKNCFSLKGGLLGDA